MKIVIVLLFCWQMVPGQVQAAVSLDTAKLLFFFGPNFIDREKYELNSAKDVLLHAKFNVQRPTVLYFHGFAEKLEDPNQHLIIDSYLIRNDHNVLLIDWELLGAGDYVGDAIPNAKKLSAPLSDAVLMLLKNGLNINKLHFVSHSLGAHLAGLVGRKIKDKSSNSYKIKRITCLDPAFPLFYPPLFFIPISKSDAEFVDIIHTDGWIYGTAFRTGTADFYPNGGQTLQPGCPPRDYLSFTPNDFCSHHRSIKFWSESIVNINTKIFSSTKCYSYTAFRLDWCKQNEVVNMGIDCPATARGSYYLKTNDKSPFAKELSTPLVRNFHGKHAPNNSIVI